MFLFDPPSPLVAGSCLRHRRRFERLLRKPRAEYPRRFEGFERRRNEGGVLIKKCPKRAGSCLHQKQPYSYAPATIYLPIDFIHRIYPPTDGTSSEHGVRGAGGVSFILISPFRFLRNCYLNEPIDDCLPSSSGPFRLGGRTRPSAQGAETENIENFERTTSE